MSGSIIDALAGKHCKGLNFPKCVVIMERLEYTLGFLKNQNFIYPAFTIKFTTKPQLLSDVIL